MENKIIEQIRVLDNPVKFKILALLVEGGTKSITDISKELKINFSTAHKYLEQLEAAGFVRSKQEATNRLKRMFYIQNFSINLSPSTIPQILRGVNVQSKPEQGIKIITNAGEPAIFDEEDFIKPYLEAGIPQKAITTVLSAISSNFYEGITQIELQNLFESKLREYLTQINSSFEILRTNRIKNKSLAGFLKIVLPEALELHANGTIFVQNLQEPRVFSFSHDLDAINTLIKPKNIDEFLEITKKILTELSSICYGAHLFDSFNIFLSPYTKALSDREIISKIEFLAEQTNLFLGLEYGEPLFVKNKETNRSFPSGKPIDYLNFLKEAERLFFLIINNFPIERIIIKLWTPFKKDMRGTYFVNMLPAWQKSNAAYLKGVRFGSEWKFWARTVRVGEVQDVGINLRRIALLSKSPENFVKQLEKVISLALEVLVYSAEQITLTRKNIYLKKIKYTHFDDSSLNISLYGLKSAAKILYNDPLKVDKVLSECEKMVNFHQTRTALRIGLKEGTKSIIQKRFKLLDKEKFGFNEEEGDESELLIPFHKFLKGGHCAQISREKFERVKDEEWGMAEIR